MSDSKELISKLENGVDALLDKVTKLSLIVKNQEQKLDNFAKLNENYKVENLRLTQEVKDLQHKIQENNSDSEQIGQYKSKINELVKEIDMCISLLNR
jgi:DNA repair ATPase RecN